MKWWWKVGLILFSVTILYVSFARAGLERVTENKDYDNLRNIPISFYAENEIGERVSYCYKLPETRILPNNPFYIIKNIRDGFWISFTKEPLEKAKLLLLIADKNLEEAIRLDEKGKQNLANKTVKEAILKLERSKKIVISLNQEDIEVMKMSTKISEAERVYKYLIDFLRLDKKLKNFLLKT